MPTPYDRYVRFLVTKGVDELELLNELLREVNLPAVGADLFQGQFELVASQVSPGVWTQIEKKSYSTGFLDEMKVLGVEELWHFEKGVYGIPKDDPQRPVLKLVYDVHQDLALRLAINSLLIKGVAPAEIATSVNYRYATMLKDPHIILYRKFFFTPEVMTRAAWRAYMRTVPDNERLAYLTALTEPLDIVKTDLELPAKHSTTETLQFLLTKSAVKAKRLLEDDTPDGRKECREWIDTVIKLTAHYEKFRVGDQADFGNALQLEFTYTETEFPGADPEQLKELAAKQKKARGEDTSEAPNSPEPKAPEPEDEDDEDDLP